MDYDEINIDIAWVVSNPKDAYDLIGIFRGEIKELSIENIALRNALYINTLRQIPDASNKEILSEVDGKIKKWE